MLLQEERATTSASGELTGIERRAAFEAARADWPSLDVSYEAFCQHLDELGFGHQLPSQPTALYLCVACSGGQAEACRVLEAAYFPRLRAFISRCESRSDMVEELLQQVRYRLLVGPAACIRSYRGDGSFEGWLRKIASSVVIDSERSRQARERRLRRLAVGPESWERVHGARALPADEQIHRQRCTRIVHGALNDALGALCPEQRQLLHHYYVSGLSIDELAALYRCDRSTAARRIWRGIATIRRAVHRDILRQLPGCAGPAIADVVRHAGSDLKVHGWPSSASSEKRDAVVSRRHIVAEATSSQCGA